MAFWNPQKRCNIAFLHVSASALFVFSKDNSSLIPLNLTQRKYEKLRFVPLFGLYFICSVASAASCTQKGDFLRTPGCDCKDTASHCFYFPVIIYFYFNNFSRCNMREKPKSYFCCGLHCGKCWLVPCSMWSIKVQHAFDVANSITNKWWCFSNMQNRYQIALVELFYRMVILQMWLQLSHKLLAEDMIPHLKTLQHNNTDCKSSTETSFYALIIFSSLCNMHSAIFCSFSNQDSINIFITVYDANS